MVGVFSLYRNILKALKWKSYEGIIMLKERFYNREIHTLHMPWIGFEFDIWDTFTRNMKGSMPPFNIVIVI